jgi:predicted 3-demethylubiquinone-9 3-methyltransferase (glyoxalase superfamily)
MATLQKITPHLWFDQEAEEAARFYTSIFPNSEVGKFMYYTGAGEEIHGQKAGTVLTVEFSLDGQQFIALNGGPAFKFNEAISFMINCESQEEIDFYWEKLGAGGDPEARQCGWLKDKYGVSWQVAPVRLDEMLRDADRARADRVMAALLEMKKLDLPELERVYAEG